MCSNVGDHCPYSVHTTERKADPQAAQTLAVIVLFCPKATGRHNKPAFRPVIMGNAILPFAPKSARVEVLRGYTRLRILVSAVGSTPTCACNATSSGW